MKGPAACLRTQPRPPLETAASAAWLPQPPPWAPCASSRARPAGLPHTARAGRGGGDTFHTAPWPRLPAGSVKAARPKGSGRVWEGLNGPKEMAGSALQEMCMMYRKGGRILAGPAEPPRAR